MSLLFSINKNKFKYRELKTYSRIFILNKQEISEFENLLNKLKTDLVTILLNLKIVEQQQEQIKSSEAISSNPKCLLNINKGKKTSRNERCPATGKKFKQCCGALQL